MIEQREIGSRVELHATDAPNLHKKSTDEWFASTRILLPQESADDFEEGTAPRYTATEYNAEVERLIAERYTTGQEIQFAREREAAGDKYTAYLAYVEQCKQMARERLGRVAEHGQQT